MKALKSIKISISKQYNEYWDNLAPKPVKRINCDDTALQIATDILNEQAHNIIKDPQFISIQLKEGLDASNMADICMITAFIYGELKDKTE